ncbi:MAG TPA: hypothetical protein PKE04_15425, partial [Clostridia bacterium]|nr:hypothetical protein [Clostridia bacterium]
MESNSTYRIGQPSLIFAVCDADAFLLGSGEHTRCAPDACYRSGPVDKVSNQLGFSFEYDARNADFFEPGSESADAFGPADLVPMPERYFPRPIQKLRLMPRRQGMVLSQGAFSKANGQTLGKRMQYAAMAFREFADMTGLPAPQRLPCEQPLHFHCEDGDG